MGGDLLGLSLPGSKGGTINLYASNVLVAPSASAPAGFEGLVVQNGLLDNSGFTYITLNSVNNVVVAGGATLLPSLAKLATPQSSATSGLVAGAVSSPAPSTSGVIVMTENDIGTSSLTLNAGVIPSNITYGSTIASGPMYPDPTSAAFLGAGITIQPQATLRAAPGGSITIGAANQNSDIDIAGSLSTSSGTIKITAGRNLTIESGAEIRAEGYNEPGVTLPRSRDSLPTRPPFPEEP